MIESSRMITLFPYFIGWDVPVRGPLEKPLSTCEDMNTRWMSPGDQGRCCDVTSTAESRVQRRDARVNTLAINRDVRRTRGEVRDGMRRLTGETNSRRRGRGLFKTPLSVFEWGARYARKPMSRSNSRGPPKTWARRSGLARLSRHKALPSLGPSSVQHTSDVRVSRLQGGSGNFGDWPRTRPRVFSLVAL